MSKYHKKKTPESEAFTDLIRTCLRFASKANKYGAELVKDIGLTPARWQLLGELYFADRLMTVSDLARIIGLSRQAVQRLINEMTADGFTKFTTNPADKRADLVQITANGRASYKTSLEFEWKWTNDIANGASLQELQLAVKVLEELSIKMDQQPV